MMQVIHFLMRFPTVNRGYSRTRPSTVLVTPIAFQNPRPRKTRVHPRDSVIKSSLVGFRRIMMRGPLIINHCILGFLLDAPLPVHRGCLGLGLCPMIAVMPFLPIATATPISTVSRVDSC